MTPTQLPPTPFSSSPCNIHSGPASVWLIMGTWDQITLPCSPAWASGTRSASEQLSYYSTTRHLPFPDKWFSRASLPWLAGEKAPPPALWGRRGGSSSSCTLVPHWWLFPLQGALTWAWWVVCVWGGVVLLRDPVMGWVAPELAALWDENLGSFMPLVLSHEAYSQGHNLQHSATK